MHLLVVVLFVLVENFPDSVYFFCKTKSSYSYAFFQTNMICISVGELYLNGTEAVFGLETLYDFNITWLIDGREITNTKVFNGSHLISTIVYFEATYVQGRNITLLFTQNNSEVGRLTHINVGEEPNSGKYA